MQQQSPQTGNNAGESQMANIEQVNIKFNEDIDRQITGNLLNGYIHQLGTPGNILLSTGIPNLPIELSASHLNKKANQKNHPFNIADIKNLPEALQKPIAIFEYGDKSKAQNIIVEIEKDGKNFLVGLSLNSDYRGIAINDIRGLFPKETANWLNWIQEGKALYLNKEKVQKLITQQRTNLAEVSNLDLNSINNIIENFKNPSLENEKNQEKMRFSIAPQVDTPEFKNWFGNSKVVDENGKPLVVYHGTNADFYIFDTEKFGLWDNGSKFKINGVDENGKLKIESIKDEGFFFSSKKQNAEAHAEGAAEMAGGSPRVISAYLKAEKPLIVEIDEFYAKIKHYDTQDWYDHNTAKILEQFHSGDYDSIIIKNPIDKKDMMYIVFNPTQIKSATDNIGTFDPDNPDIRFSENQRVDVRKQHAWAKALAKVVGHTFIDYGAAEDELRRQGIDYSPDRDGRTLHAALIEARDNLRQRINRRVKAKNLKFMQSKDEFFKILSQKYGEDFKINAGENVASPVCRRYKLGKTTCSRS